jgi:hypothetical protein
MVVYRLGREPGIASIRAGALGRRITPMPVDVGPRKLKSGLCRNCVRCPPKPRSNTVVYGDTPTHIEVA